MCVDLHATRVCLDYDSSEGGCDFTDATTSWPSTRGESLVGSRWRADNPTTCAPVTTTGTSCSCCCLLYMCVCRCVGVREGAVALLCDVSHLLTLSFVVWLCVQLRLEAPGINITLLHQHGDASTKSHRLCGTTATVGLAIGLDSWVRLNVLSHCICTFTTYACHTHVIHHRDVIFL